MSEQIKPRRVLVCGGRAFADKALVWDVLDELAEVGDRWRCGHPEFRLIHGGCRTGADAHANEWAMMNWVPTQVFQAEWTQLGRAAGPLRNAKMIVEGAPELVVQFPGGTGTADCVRRAKKLGIPVREIPARENENLTRPE